MKDWNEVRADLALDETKVAEARARMEAELRAHRLAELRKSRHLTQRQVAEAMGVQQARVSQIEHGDLSWTEFPTLQRYVEALGGDLEIVANFGDERLRLC